MANIERLPNEMVYSFKPNSALDLATKFEVDDRETVNLALKVLRKIYSREAQLLIDIASSLSKIYYDNRYDPVEIDVGDTVYL